VKQNNSDGIAAIGFGLGDKIETQNHQSFQAVFVLTKTNGKETKLAIAIKRYQ
jgi:single-stranded-DNA-specific exonuclease